MGTHHIEAGDNDFSNVVLMAGDPLRCKWIAENFLHDVKQINSIRGAYAYTGLTSNNVRISVMASGMGMPSIGIYSYELYTHYNVDVIIRIGTCGAYQDYINLFDVLLCTTASTDSNWAGQYKLNGVYSAGASLPLINAASAQLEEDKIAYHGGNILSADVFYDDDPDVWKSWAKMGVLGVEMEAYALYCNAARLRKQALCLLTVTDHFTKKGQSATPDERAYGLAKMIKSAIKIAEKFVK